MIGECLESSNHIWTLDWMNTLEWAQYFSTSFLNLTENYESELYYTLYKCSQLHCPPALDKKFSINSYIF